MPSSVSGQDLASTGRHLCGVLAALFFGLALALPGAAQDWPLWGGTAARNMVSGVHGLPSGWDLKSGRNMKWQVDLGTQSYGNPVVASGKVFVGTNNNRPRNPATTGDRGVLMTFREADGTFLWQAVSDKLAGSVDWPQVGLCSSPLIENHRAYYLTNRAELVALDTESSVEGKNAWQLDLRKELGVVPRFQAASSPVAYGKLLFVGTSNGVGEQGKVAAPRAPSLIAVDMATGKIAWTDASPGERILVGQWSSPAVGVIKGVAQVIFGGGDGWLYSFEAATGKPLWKFDANAHRAGADRGFFVGTPVVYGERVYVGLGQDPQDNPKTGRFWAIDATKRGDITETGAIWHYDGIGRTISTAAVAEGLLFISDFRGQLHCLDAETGKPYWMHDAFAAVWGSPLVADGKVYLGDEDGKITVLKAAKEKSVLAEIDMGESVYSTPVPANGVLYIATSKHLYAIAQRP